MFNNISSPPHPLPFIRLFRKGSSVSLASVIEKPVDSSRHKQRPDELDNLFDMLSTVSSNRYDDQRSPIPTIESSSSKSPDPAVVPNISPSMPLRSPREEHKTKGYSHTNSSSLFQPHSLPTHPSMPDLSGEDNSHTLHCYPVPLSQSLTYHRGIGVQSSGELNTRGVDYHDHEIARPSFQPCTEPPRRRVPTTDDRKLASVTPTPTTLHRLTQQPKVYSHLPFPQAQVKQKAKSTNDVSSNGYADVDASDPMIDNLFQTLSDVDILSYPLSPEMEFGQVQNSRGGESSGGSTAGEEDTTLLYNHAGCFIESNGLRGSPRSELIKNGRGLLIGCDSFEHQAFSQCGRKDSTLSDTNNLLFSASLGFLSPDSPILKTMSSSPKDYKHRPTMLDAISIEDIAAEM